MRTTLRLSDPLFAQVRQLAADTSRSLTAIIEEALREKLARLRSAGKKRKKIKLSTFKGTGLMPGVDISNNAQLLDIMDGYDTR